MSATDQRTEGRKGTRQFLQNVIAYIGRDEIRRKLQDDIIDPLLSHVLRRVYPYIILTCVLFVLLLLVVLLTLGIIIFQLRAQRLLPIAPIPGT